MKSKKSIDLNREIFLNGVLMLQNGPGDKGQYMNGIVKAIGNSQNLIQNPVVASKIIQIKDNEMRNILIARIVLEIARITYNQNKELSPFEANLNEKLCNFIGSLESENIQQLFQAFHIVYSGENMNDNLELLRNNQDYHEVLKSIASESLERFYSKHTIAQEESMSM